MAKESDYHKIQFYSEFPYITEVAKGVVNATRDQYNSYWVDKDIPMPSGVTENPPYIRAYVEYPSGVFSPVQGGDGLLVGWTNSRIYFFGYYNPAPYDELFKIHYFVYNRLI